VVVRNAIVSEVLHVLHRALFVELGSAIVPYRRIRRRFGSVAHVRAHMLRFVCHLAPRALSCAFGTKKAFFWRGDERRKQLHETLATKSHA
jgi:hypothetical protein